MHGVAATATLRCFEALDRFLAYGRRGLESNQHFGVRDRCHHAPRDGSRWQYARAARRQLVTEDLMDQEVFNLSMRKFLKTVGVGSQREIEQAVAKAIAAGTVAGVETLDATMTLRIAGVGLDVKFDGEIRLR